MNAWIKTLLVIAYVSAIAGAYQLVWSFFELSVVTEAAVTSVRQSLSNQATTQREDH